MPSVGRTVRGWAVACCEPSLARLLAKKYRVSSRVSAQLASDVPFSADGMDANGCYGQGDGFTVARSVQGVLAPITQNIFREMFRP
jgi:hypothetical protein